MTDVNGLRLAYRGFIAGLAGGYVWTAIAMTLAWWLYGDPVQPLRPIALAMSPLAGSSELAFVLGFATVQAGGAFVGMSFAYFFGRFFTRRVTLGTAAPVLALLVWALIAAAVGHRSGAEWLGTQLAPLVATMGYGLLLGARVPVRGEVVRA